MGAPKRRGRATARRRSRAELVQQRRFVLAVCVLALTVIITAAASNASRAEASPQTGASASTADSATTLDPRANLISATYRAHLKPSDPQADGDESIALLTLVYDADNGELTYRLEITSPLANPSIAAICQGAPGQNGSTVYTLFAGPTIAGRFSGVLCEGDMQSGALVGPLTGATLADLVLLVQRGSAYVTIGTADDPIDAARGQIN